MQLVAVFLFIGVIQLSAQTYKYQKIVGFTDATNAKLEAFLQSTISMNIRKVAVFDCDGYVSAKPKATPRLAFCAKV